MKPLEFSGRVPMFSAAGRRDLFGIIDVDRTHPFPEGFVPDAKTIALSPLEEGLLERSSVRYPGTTRAAEWVACYFALNVARRLERADPPLNWLISRGNSYSDALPLLLYTTNTDIAAFLEGRVPFARSLWLRWIQEGIAGIAEGKIEKRRGYARSFFAPSDRPWPTENPFARIKHGLPVYTRVISPAKNLRAMRLARSGLLESDALVYADW